MDMDVVFGVGDNLILALCSLFGINLDKNLGGVGVNGAIYGALYGNALSDFLAGVWAYGFRPALMIAIGCLIVIPFVYLYLYLKGR